MWYVILDQAGTAEQHWHDNEAELVGYLTKGFGFRHFPPRLFAGKSGKHRVILAAYPDWSDAQKMVATINETKISYGVE